ncbi:MAG: HAD hydrolase-like protein [Alphaproteobacteria bacterium]|nr:HAD hydrolase-like protein [Alphaproteobacteria bacterium]
MWYGKPCANAFEAAVSALDNVPGRVLVIGDGLSNDMVGARDAGHDSCFVVGGREAAGLGLAAGECPDAVNLAVLFAEHAMWPTISVPAFVW